MTVWEMRELCKEKMNDYSLTEQQRKAYENALKSLEEQIPLMDVKFFYARGHDDRERLG